MSHKKVLKGRKNFRIKQKEDGLFYVQYRSWKFFWNDCCIMYSFYILPAFQFIRYKTYYEAFEKMQDYIDYGY